MNKMVVKGRERLVRGRLKSFEELPIEKQQIFLNIKAEIQKIKNYDVYVYGSYNNGYWDEYSDYDVVMYCEPIDIKDKIREKMDVKIDIIFEKENVGYIKIP